MTDNQNPLGNSPFLSAADFQARLRQWQLEEPVRQAAHAASRVARGLQPAAGDGEPGEECSLYPTLAFSAAKPGKTQPVLDAMPLGASRIGWLPDLPARTPWPVVDGRKLLFLAQINLADLPSPTTGLLPGRGWLYAFGRFDNGRRSHVITMFVADCPADQLARADRPPNDELWPDWMGNVFYDGVPVSFHVPKARRGRDVSRAAWLFGKTDEFGSPGEIADREFLDGDDWINLLTLRSVGGMQWNDCGELYVIIRRRDLVAGTFGHAFATIGSA
jgi:hypothetical protein